MKKLLLIASLLMAGGSLWANADDDICNVGFTDGYISNSETEWIKDYCKKKSMLSAAGLDYRGMTYAIYRFCRWDQFIATYKVEWEGKEEEVLVLNCVLSTNTYGDVIVR